MRENDIIHFLTQWYARFLQLWKCVHCQESFFFFEETPLEDFNHISILTSLWSLFGTSKDFENSSLEFVFPLFAIVSEFWTIWELFDANCKVIDKICGN